MRPLSLFISTSADGMVARTDGSTDWILTDQDYGFETFFKDVDTLFMGRKTFEKVLNAGPWPHENKKTFVFSSVLKNEYGPSITIVDRDPLIFAEEYKEQGTAKIWLVGGVQLIRTLMQQNLVDHVVLNIHKEILGSGLSLFPLPLHSMFWKLVDSHEFPSGLVQVRYSLRTHDISS